MQLQKDITATNELSPKVHLRYSWPVAEILNSLSQLFINKYIMTLKGDIMHPHDLYYCIAEATLRGCWHSLHEDNNLGLLHQTIYFVKDGWTFCGEVIRRGEARLVEPRFSCC